MYLPLEYLNCHVITLQFSQSYILTFRVTIVLNIYLYKTYTAIWLLTSTFPTVLDTYLCNIYTALYLLLKYLHCYISTLQYLHCYILTLQYLHCYIPTLLNILDWCVHISTKPTLADTYIYNTYTSFVCTYLVYNMYISRDLQRLHHIVHTHRPSTCTFVISTYYTYNISFTLPTYKHTDKF